MNYACRRLLSTRLHGVLLPESITIGRCDRGRFFFELLKYLKKGSLKRGMRRIFAFPRRGSARLRSCSSLPHDVLFDLEKILADFFLKKALAAIHLSAHFSLCVGALLHRCLSQRHV